MIPAYTYGLMPTGHTDATYRAATCAVRLVDRRTGLAHRVNGNPLVIYTRQPQVAAADLLAGRDAKVWDVQIDRIEAGVVP